MTSTFSPSGPTMRTSSETIRSRPSQIGMAGAAALFFSASPSAGFASSVGRFACRGVAFFSLGGFCFPGRPGYGKRHTVVVGFLEIFSHSAEIQDVEMLLVVFRVANTKRVAPRTPPLVLNVLRGRKNGAHQN